MTAESTNPIIPERLAALSTLHNGAHKPNDAGKMCALEAAAWIAGEPWSDHPNCVCPVLGAFCRAWNDALPDDRRNEILLPLIPRLVGTRGGAALSEKRSLMAADWLVRTHTPAWLRLAGLTANADALENLPEITGFDQAPSIRGPIEAARRDAVAAGVAAGVAARDAARVAAGAAAGAAAWDAARAAAGAAAWDAAWIAARIAARVAAGAAAWVAAGDALKSTRDALIESARALVIRMIEAEA